ncbi:uncharacterized protein LOC116520820 isoform X2 [Thamnophis elegans]|uniref:uncharacterized protein LOC116520820 isoform X2 n=1 Tax=Thamnophis elegans TaxID=35005 RepID=UPI0013789FC5|nr:uncharacterized protein LOC116520820 isoform X2 [Thamnophis elegans]
MVAHGLMNTRVGGDGQSRNPSPRPSSKSPSPFSAAPRLEKCGGWASPWPWPPSCRGSWGSTASAAQGRTGSARLRTPPLPGTRPSPQRRSTGPVTHQRRGPRPVVERRTAPPGAPVRKTTWDAKFATAGWATILHPVFGCMPVKVFPARLTVCNLEPPESSSLRVACQIRHLFQCILGHLEGYLDSPVHALNLSSREVTILHHFSARGPSHSEVDAAVEGFQRSATTAACRMLCLRPPRHLPGLEPLPVGCLRPPLDHLLLLRWFGRLHLPSRLLPGTCHGPHLHSL